MDKNKTMMPTCPECNTGRLQSRGVRNNTHSLQCNNQKCKKWQTIKVNDITSDVEYTDDYINIIFSSKRIITEKDVIEQFKIDTNKWKLTKFRVKTSEGYRKDRQVDWSVTDGKATGSVQDSGKMLIVPMFHVTAQYERKTTEIRETASINQLISEMKKYSPKYTKIKYPRNKDGMMFEVEMPDLQLGRLVLADAVGVSSSPKEYVERAEFSIIQLLEHIHRGGYKINEILFPVGHDFFDANNADMMTAHGTPQQDDARWTAVFTMGSKLVIHIIDMLQTIAPVIVPIIVGNHDEERTFYLGEVLTAQYHNCKNVTIKNGPNKRKYHHYGQCLIGLTHGYYEKLDSLGGLMAEEVPDLWAKSKFKEFHVGDKHHKKDIIIKTNEMKSGVVVRILRSLATPSIWEHDKGFKSLSASEGFLWHPTKGLIAQYTSPIEI